ncbi:hypothetical protein [Pedobacter africanus]|uniref:Uncharacterized protein n=1 Tax=Pedobacter africanus TaxID=151894 RepID=A0A1W2DAG8_9SPHI|nr:hypothetical protein [Pedobacter africanus]SMC94445.1 hypothetical protein SAMN04488524_3541 [Pedobacter africanus]
MKQLKKLMRLSAVFLFMVLALAGIGVSGVPPTLSRERKLFADTESVMEVKEEDEQNEMLINITKKR